MNSCHQQGLFFIESLIEHIDYSISQGRIQWRRGHGGNSSYSCTMKVILNNHFYVLIGVNYNLYVDQLKIRLSVKNIIKTRYYILNGYRLVGT